MGKIWQDGALVDEPAELAAQRAVDTAPSQDQIAAVRSLFKAQVDAAAERLRKRVITPGSGQAMEYQEAYAEAVQVDALLQANPSATIDGSKFPMLTASIGTDLDPGPGAGAGKPTVDVAGEARSVLAAYDAYQKFGAAIRAARLKGKAAIDAASAIPDIEAAAAAISWPEIPD